LGEKYQLTNESIVAELAKIVHSDLRTLFNEDGSLKPVADWPDDVAGAVSSLEIEQLFEGTGKERVQIGHTKKLKLWDKNSAIEKAMKHLGLFEADNKQKHSDLTDEELDRRLAEKIANKR
jgi:phage terminase small subunit